MHADSTRLTSVFVAATSSASVAVETAARLRDAGGSVSVLWYVGNGEVPAAEPKRHSAFAVERDVRLFDDSIATALVELDQQVGSIGSVVHFAESPSPLHRCPVLDLSPV